MAKGAMRCEADKGYSTMKYYEVPDQPNFDHPDVCGEEGEHESERERFKQIHQQWLTSPKARMAWFHIAPIPSQPESETPTQFINRALKRLPGFQGIIETQKGENEDTRPTDVTLDVPDEAEEG